MFYLPWDSHRNGFHFPFMQFVEPTEDISNHNKVQGFPNKYLAFY